MKRIDMRKHFIPSRLGVIQGTVPQNAWSFGLVIQNRKMRGAVKGLRKSAIPFQYIADGNLPNFNKQATYEDTVIPGRFEPIKSYTASSSNEFTLNLVYVAEGSEENSRAMGSPSENFFMKSAQDLLLGTTYFDPPPQTFWTIEQIDRISAKIESLVFPQYDGKYSPPNFCLLNIGSIFIDFPVIVKSIDIQHVSPFTTRELKSFRRNINITLSSYFPLYQAIGAKDILDIALGDSFASSSRTLPRQVYSYRKFSSRRR